MATRGPKPKQKTVLAPGPLPDPPTWLDTDKALELWQTFAPVLNSLGLLENLDQLAFGMLCDGLEAYLQARDELRQETLVVTVGESNSPVQNPLVSIVRQNSKAVLDLLVEFGMTPGGRIRLTGSTSTKPEAATKDPLEALAERMNATVPDIVTDSRRPRKAPRKAAAAKAKPTPKRKPRK